MYTKWFGTGVVLKWAPQLMTGEVYQQENVVSLLEIFDIV